MSSDFKRSVNDDENSCSNLARLGASLRQWLLVEEKAGVEKARAKA